MAPTTVRGVLVRGGGINVDDTAPDDTADDDDDDVGVDVARMAMAVEERDVGSNDEEGDDVDGDEDADGDEDGDMGECMMMDAVAAGPVVGTAAPMIDGMEPLLCRGYMLPPLLPLLLLLSACKAKGVAAVASIAAVDPAVVIVVV